MPDHPGRVAPILATDGPAPADTSGWAAEVKWDGMRVITGVGGDGTVTAFARSGADATDRYPELQALTALTQDAPLVLDGEIVALDPATGKPSFGLLQQRMSQRRSSRIQAAAVEVPVTLMLFDVLQHRGRTVAGRPYSERRRLLEGLAAEAAGDRILVPPAWINDVRSGIAWSREHQLEGVILKRLNSAYRPGLRTWDWIKVKFRPSIDVVVGGWLADARGGPRSLLVGTRSTDGLHYVGAVGSGLSSVQRRILLPLLTEAAAGTSPFTQGLRRAPDEVHWVLPLLEGEVQYAERTHGGYLRQPAWKGLRGLPGE
ncbi:ATP-dependent DNA ligase [Streptomyces sp. NBC_00344]|uniref:ATP-dependent DNA ligase n=1 Tax=Streptomyces sp. NBC_00344 TaxID=2975720 RepID=UPI002E1E8D69